MSWNTLKEIYERNQKEAEEEAKKPVTQCPQCAYAPLKVNKNNAKLCPICGWTK